MGKEGKEEGVKVKAIYTIYSHHNPSFMIITIIIMIIMIIIMITIIITATLPLLQYSTVPSSKVVPRLAGCPSVTLRGTSYQCRSFMK